MHIPRLALLAASLPLACALHARPWTNTDGVTIEADLVEANDRFVVLQLPGGRRATYPLEKLIFSDQEFARDAARKQAEAAASAARAEQERLARQPKPRVLPARPDKLDTPALARIPAPADNSPAQIRKYIRNLLNFDAYNDIPGADDAQRRTAYEEQRALFAGLDETNLDLLIDEIHGRQTDVFTNTRYLAQDSILNLATENSRELVRSLYAKHYSLATILLDRGWAAGLENDTLSHLKRVGDWNYSTNSEMDLVRLCLATEDPRPAAELLRLCERLPAPVLTDVLVNLSRSRRRAPETAKLAPLLLARWQRVRKNAAPSDLALAHAVLDHGDLDALRHVARQLQVPVQTDTHQEYLLKEAAKTLLRITPAPAGTHLEMGRWLEQNLKSLSWDPATARYVKP